MAAPANSRPQGVTILAIIAVVGGVFGIMAGLTLLTLGGLVAVVLGPLGGLALVYGLVTIALSAAEIVIGLGFWSLRPAAWRWGAIFAVVRVIFIIGDVAVSGLNVVGLVVTAAVSFLFLYYLNKANVRQAFAAPASGLPIVGNTLDPYFAKINF